MDEVTDATFADEVLASDVPVIVEFGAPWCRPCKAIEPALAEIAAEAAGRVRLVKLDIDANLGTPSRYGVLSVPTVILFAGRRGAGDARRPARQEPLRADVRAVPRGVTRPWDDLLAGEELAFRTTEPPRDGTRRAPPVRPRPPGRGGAQAARHQRALHPPGRDVGGRRARRERDRHDRHGVGEVARLQPPVLDAIAREPTARALYLYPTKALTQDQARSLARFRLQGLRPAIYDGDTETERRPQIRRTANVILTNPDMLHVGILPHHDRWGDVLHNLRYVVVDEAHVYRGVFGSHVGNVLRRLRRLARAYGAEPRFLLASATIANPGELALALTGTPATVVDDGHLGPGASATSSSGIRRCSTRSSAFARARSRRRRS